MQPVKVMGLSINLSLSPTCLIAKAGDKVGDKSISCRNKKAATIFGIKMVADT